jgi:hypothetical protein
LSSFVARKKSFPRFFLGALAPVEAVLGEHPALGLGTASPALFSR